MSDRQRTRTTRWDIVALLAAGVAMIWGIQHTPAWLEGIPFARVLPAMFLMGAAIIIVDFTRVLWVQYRGPQNREEKFEMKLLNICLAFLGVLVIYPFAVAWGRIRPAFNYVTR